MCHRGRIMLSAEEKEEVRKLSGILIPVYASVVVALIAVVAVTGSRQGELVAATAAQATAR